MDIFDLPIEDDSKIPEKPGIYAFFLDLGIFLRSIENDQKFPGRKGDINEIVRKVSNALQLTNPKSESINLYGISDCVSIDINPRHRINSNLNIESNSKGFATLISLCSILSKPIYIGKTSGDTLKSRFKSHEQKYSRVSTENDKETDDPFTREGEFPDKLVRRNIELRDLIFVCISITDRDQVDYISEVEKLLHSISNPPLSVKYD